MSRVIRTDIIKCPNCDYIQKGDVEESFPFPTFIKHCERCEYIIMESEWDMITPSLGIEGEEGRCDICTFKSSTYGTIENRTFNLCRTHQTTDHLIHLINTRK